MQPPPPTQTNTAATGMEPNLKLNLSCKRLSFNNFFWMLSTVPSTYIQWAGHFKNI